MQVNGRAIETRLGFARVDRTWRTGDVLELNLPSVALIQVVLTGEWHPATTLVYTLVAGNVMSGLMSAAMPLFDQASPKNWIAFLSLLLPVSWLASVCGALVVSWMVGIPAAALMHWLRGNVLFGMLITFMVGVVTYAVSRSRRQIEQRNEELAREVQRGRQQIESHETELRSAFEIQASLLPKVIPQMAGAEIACAWQPARTVSGDFFDVLVLGEGRLGLCVADVSGKGISAALLTANLQAVLRAVAPVERDAGVVCARVNELMTANMPPGRFVTMVFGYLERAQGRMTMRYAVAGHSPPMLLRDGAEAQALEDGGPVLGMFREAVFPERRVELRAGDRVLLWTDGVTEAFLPGTEEREAEEFGEDRLTRAAGRRELKGAGPVRAAVMAEVTAFCGGSFHDDATLMVLEVTR